jgi:hypothetical protein
VRSAPDETICVGERNLTAFTGAVCASPVATMLALVSHTRRMLSKDPEMMRGCLEPFGGFGGSRKDVDGRDPVVVLVACHMLRRDQCFDVFDVQCAFRADTVLCEEVV